MANFHTHFKVSTVVSGSLAITLASINLISVEQSIVMFILGAIAGFFPDIDSDSSISLRIFSKGLALILALFLVFLNIKTLSILYLIIIAIATYYISKYLISELLKNFTRHRGVFHSITMAILFSFITVIISSKILSYSDFYSWLSGTFVFIGYLSHLILDEIYSVNLYGMKIKKSFGTAIKLYDKNSILISFILFVITAIIFVFTPTPNLFIEIVTNEVVYQKIIDKLFF